MRPSTPALFPIITFHDNSTGGNATLNLSSAAFAVFASTKSAGHMNGNCFGGAGVFSSQIDFRVSSAGEGTFTAVGGSTSGEAGAFILLQGTGPRRKTLPSSSTAGWGQGLTGTQLFLMTRGYRGRGKHHRQRRSGWVAMAARSSLPRTSSGGTASITLNGNAELDITMHNTPGVTIGSLNGAGSVLLGANSLTIGSNNQSTTFSGVIQGTGGVSKTGSGTLTLSGANTYTGGTTVSAGVLNVANKTGSGHRHRSGECERRHARRQRHHRRRDHHRDRERRGRFPCARVGTNKQATLTIQSALTFNSDATYTYTFKAKRNKARTDLVIANGVTINGATLNLSGQTQGTLKRGLRLTLISNTSANPISGTFSNLPDGGIVTINGNNFQASYEGGDGNDLTLTVVP